MEFSILSELERNDLLLTESAQTGVSREKLSLPLLQPCAQLSSNDNLAAKKMGRVDSRNEVGRNAWLPMVAQHHWRGEAVAGRFASNCSGSGEQSVE